MFPRKSGQPGQAEQAAKLKALRATRWWRDVSAVNPAKLRVAREDVAKSVPQLRRLLQRFAWTEEEATGRLRDRRDWQNRGS